MDNLTHSLVGLVAAKAGLERVSPYATAVCVMAANLPDADIVMVAGGGLTYLEHHRGITHSIVGTLALAILFPLLFFGVERLVARLRNKEPRARLGGLFLASALLTASHPLLDWTNSYGLRPFLPWDGRWFYGDLVFVVDPWLWLVLGGALFLLTAKTNLRVALWSVAACVVAAAVLFLPERRGFEIPLALRILWVAGLAAFIIAYRLKLATRFGASIAFAALASVVVYWGALALLHARALESAHLAASELAAPRGETVLRVAAMPQLMNPLRWLSVSETDRATYRYSVGVGRAGAKEEAAHTASRHEKPSGEVSRAVEGAREDERGRIFLDFARFPVFRLLEGEGGEKSLRVTDVRFYEPPPEDGGGGGSFTVEIPLGAPRGESE